MRRRPTTSTLFPYTTLFRSYYVHPVNIQTACLIMEGAEFTENIINGVERPVKAAELFAFTLRVREQFSGFNRDRKSGSAGMPRPISYAVFCLKKKKKKRKSKNSKSAIDRNTGTNMKHVICD